MVRYIIPCRAITCLLVLQSASSFAPSSLSRTTNTHAFQRSLSTSPSRVTPMVNPSTESYSPTSLSMVSLPSLPSISLPNVELSPRVVDLLVYLAQTVISTGVPAVATIAVIAFAANAFKPPQDENERRRDVFGFGSTAADELYDDLYGDGSSSGSAGAGKLFSMLNKGPKKNGLVNKNIGVPSTQYIKIERINDKLSSYEYSMAAATKSKSYAASKYRAENFERAMGKAVNSVMTPLTNAEKTDMLREERLFLKEGAKALSQVEAIKQKLVMTVMERTFEELDVAVGELDPHAEELENQPKNVTDAEIIGSEGNTAATTTTSFSKKKKEEKNSGFSFQSMNPMKKKDDDAEYYEALAELDTKLMQLELEFLQQVISILGAERANGVRAAILGNIGNGSSGSSGSLLKSLQERPLATVLRDVGYTTSSNGDDVGSSKKQLFVTNFPGDVSASQVEELREEVTAILRGSNPGDEALLVLQSGGGTVTGYGLAAAQLRRLKDAGMKLTICVEQVAASGGYMMCCVADKIVASPFAVLGSIGVISDMPNVYERLKKEGVEFQTVTAGKYKRTLTPTKKPTKEDLEKSKADIEDILTLFKAFVHKNRPSLDIDSVATGETWFGEDALERKLCDEIKTKDEILLEFIDSDYDVYSVKYEPEQDPLKGLPFTLATSNSRQDSSIASGPIRWLVQTVMTEFQREFASAVAQSGGDVLGKKTTGVENMYQATDTSDAANRVRASADLNNVDVERLF